jgi:hypothetical protein
MDKLRACLALLGSVVAFTASAADGTGSFSVRGAGLLTCDIFVKERAQQSRAYLMIGGWLDGYINGLNQYAPETYDIVSFESTELLAVIIAEHCQAHPKDRLFSVVNTIVIRLGDDRIRERSPLTAVKVGKYETRLYEETLRRVQRALSERGHFSGQLTGSWDDKTERALRAFQRASDLQATGFPDQKTLWRLLRRERAAK